MESSPSIVDAKGIRSFACNPVALLSFILNEYGEFLLLKMPGQTEWEVPCGALEAGESVLDGATRECAEEIGEEAIVEPLGVFHAYSYHYDDRIRFMTCLCFLFRYQKGKIVPGDDMLDADYQWASLPSIVSQKVAIRVPLDYLDLFRRGFEVWQQWESQPIPLGYVLPVMKQDEVKPDKGKFI